jgi:multiple sugar transport system ATP-binding protein
MASAKELGGMAEIELRDIRKGFGSYVLFRGLSLKCPDHGYLCLLGPSGCGKTTLLRIVAGLAAPDAGDVLFGGRRVNDKSPAERNVGLAFQNYALYPHISVAGNLAFPLRAPVRRRGYSKVDVDHAVQRIAALLKIDALLQRQVNQLSGGQQQRVALGRALIHDPQVLLLDEPVTHLDARLRYEMRAELKLLHQRLGTTTLHVTHDQQEALAMADLIAVMRDGAIIQVGSPLELYDRPATAFVAGFIGDPPMSVLRARTEGEALRIGDKLMAMPPELATRARAADSPGVLIGLRPQNVHVVPAGSGDLEAFVYSHEMVGREQQLQLSMGDERIRCRLKEPVKVTAGSPIGLRLSLERAKLFDAASERAL